MREYSIINMRLSYCIVRTSIYLLLFISVLGLGACSKDRTLVVVPNNQAPPDTLIPGIVLNTYVNKSYVALLGRKPSTLELSQDSSFLAVTNATKARRVLYIQRLMQAPQYKERLYEAARIDLLANLDTTEISFYIQIYKDLQAMQTLPGTKDEIQREIDKLVLLQKIPQDLQNGTCNQIELHRRCILNPFYDEINMGSLNFILSVFEHFLQRKPTESEKTAAVKIVDGEYANLFGQEGAGKSTFVKIFLESGNYFEGEVVNLFERFLLRKPSPTEMAKFAVEYRSHKDYDKLLTEILTLDEYVGVNK